MALRAVAPPDGFDGRKRLTGAVIKKGIRDVTVQ
jgi:hypothetical protein